MVRGGGLTQEEDTGELQPWSGHVLCRAQGPSRPTEQEQPIFGGRGALGMPYPVAGLSGSPTALTAATPWLGEDLQVPVSPPTPGLLQELFRMAPPGRPTGQELGKTLPCSLPLPV